MIKNIPEIPEVSNQFRNLTLETQKAGFVPILGYKSKLWSGNMKLVLWRSTLDYIGDGAIRIQLPSATTDPSEILSQA
jgi:hypothetical protein